MQVLNDAIKQVVASEHQKTKQAVSSIRVQKHSLNVLSYIPLLLI